MSLDSCHHSFNKEGVTNLHSILTSLEEFKWSLNIVLKYSQCFNVLFPCLEVLVSVAKDYYLILRSVSSKKWTVVCLKTNEVFEPLPIFLKL